jgi:hypothetical protein
MGLMLLFSIQFIVAQTKVSGTVTDESGQALVGVNVVIKGTSQGTITNVDGKYSITASADAQLVFNYVGYEENVQRVGNRTVINVTMKESAKSLERSCSSWLWSNS